MPALDVVALECNEGFSYNHDLSVLIAASGDIRNLLKTVAGLPDEYQHPVSLTLDDRDFDIVARNLIMLLAIMKIDGNVYEVLETVIHLWYSAKLRSSELCYLQSTVKPLFEEVCVKIKDKPIDALLAKTWTFGLTSLRVTLSKKEWMLLPSYLEVPKDFSSTQADEIRRSITTAPQRKDYQDRHVLLQAPSHRVCKQRFREDGILLPFAYSRQAFDSPNPTFYQNDKNWPMTDSADPLDGWDLGAIIQNSKGSAANDIYGKLFNYLGELLSSFVKQLSSREVAFELFNMDAQNLPRHFGGRKFARIEVSNISVGGYLGVQRTLAILSPLLQERTENPHATLITLFMNAVGEVAHSVKPSHNDIMFRMRKVRAYLPVTGPLRSRYDPTMILHSSALDLLRDNDELFKQYMKEVHFLDTARLLNLTMKQSHSIVEKWPMRLRLKSYEAGAKEEFKILLASAHSGAERYVEWKRS